MKSKWTNWIGALCLLLAACAAFWGVNDAVSWLHHGSPLRADGNSQPKPAFDAVIRVATNPQPKSP